MDFNIKKIICITAAMCVTLSAFAACSGDENKSESNSKSESVVSGKEIDFDALKDDMLAADEALPAMSLASSVDENGEELFAYLAEYDYEYVEEYFFSYASMGTAEEIAVIRLCDEEHAKDCADAVKEHVENRIIQFETYDPTQVPRCEEAVVFYNDAYVVLIICDNDDAVKDAFYDSFE